MTACVPVLKINGGCRVHGRTHQRVQQCVHAWQARVRNGNHMQGGAPGLHVVQVPLQVLRGARVVVGGDEVHPAARAVAKKLVPPAAEASSLLMCGLPDRARPLLSHWAWTDHARAGFVVTVSLLSSVHGEEGVFPQAVYQSKGLATTQLAPQGAAAGDPSSRLCLPAIDCSFGHRAAAAWGVRLLSSLFQQSQQTACCASTGSG